MANGHIERSIPKRNRCDRGLRRNHARSPHAGDVLTRRKSTIAAFMAMKNNPSKEGRLPSFLVLISPWDM